MEKRLAERLQAAETSDGLRLDLGGLGLHSLPREVYDFADTLELLNLTQNALQDLPDDLGRLSKLRILFASQNDFSHVPEVVGGCEQLSMVGFKANRIELVSGAALPQQLRWLILTDNRLTKLPTELGHRHRLQKLMLSGNALDSLPEAMADCMNLELVRLASNRFKNLPNWLLELPRLAWLAVAGNPCAATSIQGQGTRNLMEVGWEQLQLGERLGEGASGWVHQARWQDRWVAVKIFKGVVTSDGLPENEMAASIAAGKHPHLIEALAKVVRHPQAQEALLLALLDEKFSNLAGPPSFETCTRDVYDASLKFTLSQVIAIAKAMASVAQQLHQRGLMHGDFYAHNMVWDGDHECLLGDFGGASFYDRSSAHAPLLERLEVRAYGYLLEELLQRCETNDDRLLSLQEACLRLEVKTRPDFAEVTKYLAEYTG